MLTSVTGTGGKETWWEGEEGGRMGGQGGGGVSASTE